MYKPEFIIGVKKPKLIEITLIFMSILIIISIFGISVKNPPFTPDSWSYFELSKSISKDFYRINTFRQLQFTEPYGVSFPPLYPTIIFIVNLFSQTGIYAGYIFNFLIVVCTLFLFIKISELIFQNKIIGIFLFLLLILNPYYVNEAVAARSIPLSIFLFFTMFLTILKLNNHKGKSIISYVLLGFLSGLMLLTRYDFLLPSIVLGIMLIFRREKISIKLTIVYYSVFFVTVSPYIWYSYTHFGMLFVSDNSRTVLLAFDNFVTDYFSQNEKLETIFNSPILWLNQVIHRSVFPIYRFLIEIMLKTGFLIALMGVSAIVFHKSIRVNKINMFIMKDANIKTFLILLPSLLIQIISIFLTGYSDLRYYVLIIIFITWLLTYLLFKAYKGKQLLTFEMNNLLMVILSFCIIFNYKSLGYYSLHFLQTVKGDNIVLNDDNIKAEEFNELLGTLINEDLSSIRIMFDDGEVQPHVNLYKFGALTGISTVTSPRNLGIDNIKSLIEDFKINYVYMSDPKFINKLEDEGYKLEKRGQLPLFKLIK